MVKAIGFAVLIWMVGFVWGSVVFMTPALKELPSIPYVSKYPAISFPLLVVFPLLAWLLAKNCLKTAAEPAEAGLRLGIIFAGVNFLLDLLVLVLALDAGLQFFASASVWLGYALLFVVPWQASRS